MDIYYTLQTNSPPQPSLIYLFLVALLWIPYEKDHSVCHFIVQICFITHYPRIFHCIHFFKKSVHILVHYLFVHWCLYQIRSYQIMWYFHVLKIKRNQNLLPNIYEITLWYKKYSEHKTIMLKSAFSLWKESYYEFCQDQTIHFFINLCMSKHVRYLGEK